MSLESLDFDVLSQILALLDVFTIVSVSQVNKTFHVAASAKQLWLSVVRDLSSRRLIDPPAAEILETFSTAELIEEVKRGAVGPRTWSSSSAVLPTLSREIDISWEPLQEGSVVIFLQDGRHIMFYTVSGGVECWEVHSGRRVWAWASPGYIVDYVTFDVCQGGSKAVVSLVEKRLAHNTIIILEADLRTGESHDLLHFPIDTRYPPRGQVWGDFFACGIGTDWYISPSPLLLINWRTAEFVLFDSSHVQLSTIPWAYYCELLQIRV
ncbi:hypothetical protein FB451DRAFT_182404 [Mycena latifolia]|nr:hypothetical protein FB451DRAFT_182404 [Mycena latifolia]